jgi:hypothetical protein
MFQAMRPPERWSRLDSRRTIEYGSSNAVDKVTPTPNPWGKTFLRPEANSIAVVDFISCRRRLQGLVRPR